MAKPVERTRVRMYNDRNELLKEKEISGETEETVLEEETAYVIVEEEKAGGSVPQTIPIIAMTADAFAEDIRNCLDCGMNAHVAKPIDIDELIRLLKKHMVRM